MARKKTSTKSTTSKPKKAEVVQLQTRREQIRAAREKVYAEGRKFLEVIRESALNDGNLKQIDLELSNFIKTHEADYGGK